MSRSSSAILDATAVALSGLCLIHCLALPLLAAFSPLLGLWSDQEWVHLLLAAIAVPLSAMALWTSHRRRRLPALLAAMGVAGACSLLVGATEWPGAAMQTPVTVAGALMLAAAHAWNWLRHAPGRSGGGHRPP